MEGVPDVCLMLWGRTEPFSEAQLIGQDLSKEASG